MALFCLGWQTGFLCIGGFLSVNPSPFLDFDFLLELLVYGETNKSNTESYLEINASNIKILIKKSLRQCPLNIQGGPKNSL